MIMKLTVILNDTLCVNMAQQPQKTPVQCDIESKATQRGGILG